MSLTPIFPTSVHKETAEVVRDFFLDIPCIDTILVVNSCARGHAVPESDLDFAILVKPGTTAADIETIESSWKNYFLNNAVILNYKHSNPFLQVHLDIVKGQYNPAVWDDGGGPDFFEVEIGNHVCYSAPFGKHGNYFSQLKSKWLPYYNEDLRLSRLTMVLNACKYDLDHIPFFVNRGLYFQAFDRLYKAFQEFLQALFIANRTYPIAYNKWIKEQIEKLLNMPELYSELPPIIAVSNIESNEVIEKASILDRLLLQIKIE